MCEFVHSPACFPRELHFSCARLYKGAPHDAIGRLRPLGEQHRKVSFPPCRVSLVWRDVSLGARRVQNGFDPAAKPRRGFRDALPDRLQNGKHKRGIDGVDRQVPNRLAIVRQRPKPLASMLAASPAGLLRLEKQKRAFAKRLFGVRGGLRDDGLFRRSRFYRNA